MVEASIFHEVTSSEKIVSCGLSLEEKPLSVVQVNRTSKLISPLRHSTMKTAIVASLVASAAAFAPSQQSRSSVSLQATMDNMPGSVDFRGKEFKFDPLGFSETYAPLVPFFRESELRHGRTAMIAVVGFIVADLVRIPGEMYSFSHVPSSAAAHDILVKDGPMGQLLLWIGLFDTIVTAPACAATMKGEREPGDFGWDFAKPKDAAAYKKKVDSELLNGRLAMMAFGGIVTQAVMTGKGFPYI